jgi:hypothetical protein
MGVSFVHSGAEDGLYCHPRFLKEHTEKGLSVFEPALVAGVFEEKASSSSVCFEACVYSDD